MLSLLLVPASDAITTATSAVAVVAADAMVISPYGGTT
jgi:hypothetical protein